VLINDVEIRDTTNTRIASDSSPISERVGINYFMSSDLESISSYVMQDDILEATMTPQEILLFTAKLKVNLPEIEIERRVHKMLSELNLQNCKNIRIGNNLERGVSGGERKRTSIGVELISDPLIVFLDEPTTGLDSYNAYEVVQKICELAKEEGKIIIFTIHQPSSEIFQLLDKIFILADGKTVYFGPSDQSLNFFTEELQLPYPSNYNPFEYFIERTNMEVLFNKEVQAIKAYGDILSEAENKNDNEKLDSFITYIQLLSDIFTGKKRLIPAENQDPKVIFIEFESKGEDEKEKILHRRSNRSLTKKDTRNAAFEKVEIKEPERSPKGQQKIKAYIDEIISEKKTTKGFCYEFSTLFGRNTILSTRNKKILFLKVIQTVFTGILLSILFKNVKGI
jgi:ABC-type multidrug transport system ATPase subunit